MGKSDARFIRTPYKFKVIKARIKVGKNLSFDESLPYTSSNQKPTNTELLVFVGFLSPNQRRKSLYSQPDFYYSKFLNEKVQTSHSIRVNFWFLSIIVKLNVKIPVFSLNFDIYPIVSNRS